LEQLRLRPETLEAIALRERHAAAEAELVRVRELGADVLIDYRDQDAAAVALSETGGRGVDAAFDIQGSPLVSRCLPAVRPFGRVACILEPQGDLSPLYQKNITLHGTFLTREGARLDEMRPLFERGQARVVIDQVLPLERVGEAHARLDTGHGRGKVVLRVAEE
jgi:NADPH2:quinone reductase